MRLVLTPLSILRVHKKGSTQLLEVQMQSAVSHVYYRFHHLGWVGYKIDSYKNFGRWTSTDRVKVCDIRISSQILQPISSQGTVYLIESSKSRKFVDTFQFYKKSAKNNTRFTWTPTCVTGGEIHSQPRNYVGESSVMTSSPARPSTNYYVTGAISRGQYSFSGQCTCIISSPVCCY
jgi:hypothetical protein